jgi:hypothetical protein
MPSKHERHELTVLGEEIVVEHQGPQGSGARIDIEHEDGRKWRCIVSGTGKLTEIETTWRDGQLADIDEPDWMEDVLSQLARAA